MEASFSTSREVDVPTRLGSERLCFMSPSSPKGRGTTASCRISVIFFVNLLCLLQIEAKNIPSGAVASPPAAKSLPLRRRIFKSKKLGIKVGCGSIQRKNVAVRSSARPSQAPLPLYASTIDVTRNDLYGSDSTEGMTRVIDALEKACIEISTALARVNIDRRTGDQGDINIQGEKQKKIDVYANELIKRKLFESGVVGAIASEEEDDIVLPSNHSVEKGPIYAVAFDPLDGSSNIDCSVPTGTIFSIYQIPEEQRDSLDSTNNPFLSPVTSIIASGYVMYSSATSLVLSFGKGTHILSLDPDTRKFVLTGANMRVPNRGPYYSLNEGRYFDWPNGLRNYISDVKQGKGTWGKKYSSRYVCSLVADVHRTILYGGWAGNPRPHLRLLFEAAPLSFILDQAGGKGSDGNRPILSYTPDTLHQRLPVFLGSSEDIEELESYGDVQQGKANYEA